MRRDDKIHCQGINVIATLVLYHARIGASEEVLLQSLTFNEPRGLGETNYFNKCRDHESAEAPVSAAPSSHLMAASLGICRAHSFGGGGEKVKFEPALSISLIAFPQSCLKPPVNEKS